MQITVLYFASLREQIGLQREQLELPATVQSLGALRDWLIGRGTPWSLALANGKAVRMAIDQMISGPETPLRAGAEVAYFPPVTGG